ncbi:hypothetical protein IQ07DRAFT_493087, partial [Pyrenochaeta sp. DS3sAY3a]
LNPIIPGFAPDPSIVRIQDTFYVVTSSFHLFPGLPIYSSTDLIEWHHIGNAINRETQLSLALSRTYLSSNPDFDELIPATGGLYAPTIRHHKGRTYILCTNVIHSPYLSSSSVSFENFIISTTDIEAGHWTDPIYFDFHGIDPDLFFDASGNAHVQGSKWGESTTINSFEINLKTGEKLSPEKVIWTGFTKVIPEGPHLYAYNGWIYLLVAEGGTHEGHQITIARSRSIDGPFESCPSNPILGPANADAAVQWTGHGDIFEDVCGDWWLVCLGARKRGNACVMGRETFLSRVHWTADGWPTLDTVELNLVINEKQAGSLVVMGHSKAEPLNGHISFVCIRDPLASLSDMLRDERGTQLALRPSIADLDSIGSVSFIGKRQRRLHGMATLAFDTCQISGLATYKAGLALYKDEHRFGRIGWNSATSEIFFELVNNALCIKQFSAVKIAPASQVVFSLTYTSELIEFAFEDSDTRIKTCLALVDARDMTGRDFVGPVIGAF